MVKLGMNCSTSTDWCPNKWNYLGWYITLQLALKNNTLIVLKLVLTFLFSKFDLTTYIAVFTILFPGYFTQFTYIYKTMTAYMHKICLIRAIILTVD